MKCLKDCMLCPSLSGVDVPYLIVTSRANEIDYQNIEVELWPLPYLWQVFLLAQHFVLRRKHGL